ncbi:MAG: DUF6504 family protein [Armatimonadia bacterium]
MPELSVWHLFFLSSIEQKFYTGAMLMGKLINEPIQVTRQPSLFERDPLPRRFTWRGRDYLIATLGGEWRELGRWWEGEGERRYLRAVTSRGMTVDLCQDLKTGQWTVAEVQD